MKTAAREEDFPMTDTVFWACTQLLRRYKRICRRLKIAPSPEHYLFPGRARAGKLDPTRPLRSFKTAWKAICKAAGVSNLRIEDVRHTVNTKMEELTRNQTVSQAVRERIMGHEQGTRVNVDYRHIRYQPMLDALKQIEVKPVQPVETVDNVITLPKAQAVAGGKKSS